MPELVIGDKEISCRGIFFDKDGTLIDFSSIMDSIFWSRVKAIKELTGLDIKKDFALSCGYKLETREIDPLGPIAVAPKKEEEILLAGLLYRQKINWPQARELASQIFKRAEELLDEDYSPEDLPCAEEKLRLFHQAGFLIGLVTGDSHLRAQKIVEKLNWQNYFDLIVGSDEVEKPKPAPDLVLACCKQLSLLPEEVVVIGDSPLDGQMGKEAGVKATIAVATGITPHEELLRAFDLKVDSLCQIQVAD